MEQTEREYKEDRKKEKIVRNFISNITLVANPYDIVSTYKIFALAQKKIELLLCAVAAGGEGE